MIFLPTFHVYGAFALILQEHDYQLHVSYNTVSSFYYPNISEQYSLHSHGLAGQLQMLALRTDIFVCILSLSTTAFISIACDATIVIHFYPATMLTAFTFVFIVT